MRSLKIDGAPGKELIPVIIETKSLHVLKEFYNLRVKWNENYPLIHDGLGSYGIFHDLNIAMKKENAFSLVFIDHAFEIAKDEKDRNFLCSIFLLSDFCNYFKEFLPTEPQLTALSLLKERARKFSFFPNMSCFWRQIIDFFAKNESFEREHYAVSDNDYKSIINLNFPVIDDSTIFPLTDKQMDDKFFSSKWDQENLTQRYLLSTAQIEYDKYWVWVYKAQEGKPKNQFVFIRQGEKGETDYKYETPDIRIEPNIPLKLLRFHYQS